MAGRLLNTELKEFVASTLNGTYQNFGTALTNPALKIMIINTSDVDVYISEDGATNKFRVPSGAAMTLDESTYNIPNRGQEYYLERLTQLTITQVTAAGTTGNIIAHIVTRTL